VLEGGGSWADHCPPRVGSSVSSAGADRTDCRLALVFAVTLVTTVFELARLDVVHLDVVGFGREYAEHSFVSG
jgi:hypothetical protein